MGYPDLARGSETNSEGATQLVVIAASAGGLRALLTVLSGLTRYFTPATMIVQHADPHRTSMLVEILGRKISLPIKQAENGEQLKSGVVYTAPPNWHLVVTADGTVALNQTDPVHFLRPSADLLFKSAAESFGESVLAVILSGTGSDGTSGSKAIKSSGGKVIVQDEATSEFFGMPRSVILAGCADLILPLQSISAAMLEWSLQETMDDTNG